MSNPILYRAAEKALYTYQELKGTVQLYETKSMMRGRGMDDAVAVKTSSISDPTAQGGISLAAPPKPVRDAIMWVMSIETAWAELTQFAKPKAVLMEQYYGLTDSRGRPRGSQPSVRFYLMQELNISYKTFYNWKNDCVDSVVHAAIQYGVLVPYPTKRSPA